MTALLYVLAGVGALAANVIVASLIGRLIHRLRPDDE